MAFISYKHSLKSRPFAVDLENALKKYGKPLWKPPIKIFRDEKEIQPGEDLGDTIKKALYKSEYLIYLATKEAAESAWVKDEIKIWCGDLKRVKNLIIVLIDDNISYDKNLKGIIWEKSDALPIKLKEHITSIPLYVDLKWAGEGVKRDLNNIKYRNAVNSIVALFRGLKPGEMTDQAVLTHRRNTKLAIAAIITLIISLISTSTAAYMAIIQRNNAIEQRNTAIALNYSINANELIRIGDYTKAICIASNAYKLKKKYQALQVLTHSFYASIYNKAPFYQRVYEHSSSVISLSFSPDEKYILTGCSDNTAILWKTDTGEVTQIYKGKPNYGTHYLGISVAFSPNGQYVLTALDEKIARLWDLKGNKIREFTGHQNVITSVAFSDDGKYILTGSLDKTAILWNPNDEKALKIFKGHTEAISSVVFAQNDIYFATGSEDKTVKLWSINSDKELLTLQEHKNKINAVAFSPNNKYLITGSDDNSVKLWDIKTGKLKASFLNHKKNRWGAGGVNAVCFSPHGKSILTAGKDNTIILWDIENNKKIAVLTGHGYDENGYGSINGIDISQNGKLVITGGSDNTVKLWDIDSLNRWKKNIDVKKISSKGKKYKYLQDSIISPGKKYKLVSSDKTAKLIELRSGKVVRSFIESNSITSIAFSPDGKFVLTGNEDNNAKIWSTETGKRIQMLIGHKKGIGGIDGFDIEEIVGVFLKEGKQVLTGGTDRTVKLWNIITGKEIRTYTGGDLGTITIIAPTDDGEFFFTGSQDGNTIMWDKESGQIIQIYRGKPSFPIESITISEDERFLLTTTSDEEKIWLTPKGIYEWLKTSNVPKLIEKESEINETTESSLFLFPRGRV